MPKEPAQSLLFIVIILLVGGVIAWAGSQGGALVGGVPVFALCAAISFGLNGLFFIPAYAYQTEHYFDLAGSITYWVLLITSLTLSPHIDKRDLLIGGMIALWATRLGTFLFIRIRRDGSDGRFDRLKTRAPRFLMVWVLQGLWVLLTAACGLAAINSAAKAPLGIMAATGASLWLIGMAIEITADQQKKRFRLRPENEGRFITTGIWAWSQHPNYFGEILLWAGIALVALPNLFGWQLLTLISPLFVFILLTRISGIPLLKARGQKRWGREDDYQDYIQRTPVLVPRPPR
jgi:steroid 5-alpha reductase family enzyme